MIRNTISIIILCIFSFFLISSSCKEDPKPTLDAIGEFDWSAWTKVAGWTDYSASDYVPHSDIIVELSSIITTDHQFIIFGSNWCIVDCATQMPRVKKLLTLSGVAEHNIKIIGINRDRNEPLNWMQKFYEWFPQIERIRVPTLIILKGETPIGYIKTETIDFPLWQEIIIDVIKN